MAIDWLTYMEKNAAQLKASIIDLPELIIIDYIQKDQNREVLAIERQMRWRRR